MQSKGLSRVFSNTTAQKHQFFGAHLSLGFPGSSEVKASAHNAGYLGSILGSGRSPGVGNGNPLQYSCLENPTAFFLVQLSHPYMTTGRTIALTRWTYVGNVMSLLFNMLSRVVITFLPRSKRLLISWLQSQSAVILEPKNKV